MKPKSLLVINASGRVTRSVTRHLTQRFVDRWIGLDDGAAVTYRDVGLEPPTAIDEAWIAAGFTEDHQRTPEMREALSTSEALIEEIENARVVVMGVPMYNFGMPAAMKAYLDQIVRVGRTFALTGDDSHPYQPLLESKPLVIISAAGTSGYEPGGHSEHLNFLDPHLRAVMAFIGLDDAAFVRVVFEEQQDGQFKRSLSAAEAQVDAKVDELLGTLALSGGGLKP
ncbi:FMN-dependent NADH-azoreductase [Phragmitibacter flavus]|uniref:FMN dependent NADH:quinone oxidoreductase n=1 Tax=Phragmitibacter flavus TaxID=2576071 RepID=A0A5R8KKW1_9BACT|nr:NAD(P)H-dependent oxidoreductase [Phragmitibacter flavus]TLD72279.1 FMN-dependent NADH-azoreductase [Phragmitibacter flavus]